MEKFKKIAKITLFCLLVGTIISLSLCYIIIPEQTKQAIDVVVGYLNTPLGIAGGTTITAGVIVCLIIKYIVVAHKVEIKNALEKAKNYSKECELKAQESYDNAKQTYEDIKVYLKGYSTEIDKIEECVIKLCDTIPNAKVKALGEEIKLGTQEVKEQVNVQLSVLEDTYKVHEEIAKDKVAQLEDKIKELTEKFERLVESYGEEREETIDHNTKEE